MTDITSQVSTVRAAIAALENELSTVTHQRRSRAQVSAYVDQAVDGWAAQATAQQDADMQHCAAGDPVELLTLRTVVATDRGSLRLVLPLGPILVQMLGADVVRKDMAAQIKSVPTGLAPTARTARLSEIAAEMDRRGYEEETLLRNAEAARVPIDPRPNADPRHALTWKEIK